MQRSILNKYDNIFRMSNIKVSIDRRLYKLNTIFTQSLNTNSLMLIKINKSINRLNFIDRKIIYKKYIEDRSSKNVSICLELSISESTFYRRINTALIHFNESYYKQHII